MKVNGTILTTLLLIFFFAGSISAREFNLSGKGRDVNKNGGRSTWLVVVPYTPEECVKTINEFKEKGAATLSKFKFGCHSGNHTAYAFINASSKEEVRKMVPADLQSRAKIEKVETFTPQQLEIVHKDKK